MTVAEFALVQAAVKMADPDKITMTPVTPQAGQLSGKKGWFHWTGDYTFTDSVLAIYGHGVFAETIESGITEYLMPLLVEIRRGASVLDARSAL